MRRDTERDGRFRISTLADFEGTEVAPRRHDRALHARLYRTSSAAVPGSTAGTELDAVGSPV